MSFQELKRLDFQLAYLALLTRRQVKPLSRWEQPLTPGELDALRSVVPEVRTVRRRTDDGRSVTEVLFARGPRYPKLYELAFAGRPIRHTGEDARREGRLFGYPSCCVEAFVNDPYAANDLAPEDQELLFHWACPGCKVTPLLLREYRSIHRECSSLLGTEDRLRRGSGARGMPALGRWAASIALIAGPSALASSAVSGQVNPHWLPTADDPDCDHLTVADEILCGTDWERLDTDDDTVLDGVQTALRLSQLVASPPPGVTVTPHPLRGVETCLRCGALVNMGSVTVSHDSRGLNAELPNIALHYLEHGSLGFEGDIHAGRVDMDALKRILMPYDAPHLLTLWYGDDPDEDGLYWTEEMVVGTQPEVADTDGDSIPDGPQLAEDLITMVSQLPREPAEDRPYLRELRMDGLIQCGVCGASVNMGSVEIVNPLADVSIQAPYLALHAVAHGSFDHTPMDWGRSAGKIVPRGVLPTMLRAVLTSEGPAHWIPVDGDSDGDGLTDAEEAWFLMDGVDPDENGNTRPDGRELAQIFAGQIEALPEGPLPDEPYRITSVLLGTEFCYTCGQVWAMGQYEVVNPVAGVSVVVPFYNVHFMRNGSFSSDGASFSRIDPRDLAEALGPHATGIVSQGVPSSFSFSNAPNPFPAGTTTRIALTLPVPSGRVEVAIYDAAGRKVRDLYTGEAQSPGMVFHWNGRDGRGRTSSAGVYFCEAKLGDLKLIRKMTLVP